MSESQQQSVAAASNAALSYDAGWITNGLSWSSRPDMPFRFAVGSFVHEYRNTVDIVQKADTGSLVCRASWTHCYPPTKIQFSPDRTSNGPDLMATTADYLRVWEVKDTPEAAGLHENELDENAEGANGEGDDADGKHHHKDDKDKAGAKTSSSATTEEQRAIDLQKKKTINSQVSLRKVFDFGKPNDFCSPVTSCDWNADDPSIIGCCSIDTTVTIWDIAAEKHQVQLIAHDKDVYDIAFSKGTHTFASCGADGAVRVFDLREMEHCTIVWESPQLSPLLRVAWNKHDQTYLSTFGINDSSVVVIDIRYPSSPVGVLRDGHRDSINSIHWAPHSAHYMCSAGEDCAVNIWNLSELPRQEPERFLTYDAPAPVNNVSWSSLHHKHVAITAGTQAQVLPI